jgi:hypothetical protein
MRQNRRWQIFSDYPGQESEAQTPGVRQEGFRAVSASAGGWQIFSDYPDEKSEAATPGFWLEGFVRFPGIRRGWQIFSDYPGRESEAATPGGQARGFSCDFVVRSGVANILGLSQGELGPRSVAARERYCCELYTG